MVLAHVYHIVPTVLVVLAAHSKTENHAAPSEGRYQTDFCALHYRDLCNAISRKWRLCSNSRIGCSHLAQEPRSGKSHACNTGCPPCAHSMSGCPSHVRNSDKITLRLRKTCSSHNHQRCPFDPSNTLSCSTSMCGNPRVSATESRCPDCIDEHVPCSQNCSRRTVSISETLCQLCSRQAPPTASASSVDPVSVLLMATDHPPSVGYMIKC